MEEPRIIKGTFEDDCEQQSPHKKLTLQDRVSNLEARLDNIDSNAINIKKKPAESKKWTTRRVIILLLFIIVIAIILINLYQVIFLGYAFSF